MSLLRSASSNFYSHDSLCSVSSAEAETTSYACWERLRTVVLAIRTTRATLKYHQSQVQENGDLYHLIEGHQLTNEIRNHEIVISRYQKAVEQLKRISTKKRLNLAKINEELSEKIQTPVEELRKRECSCPACDTICGVHLPLTREIVSHQEIEVAAAFGHIAHFLDCLSFLLDYIFRYPVLSGASTSCIHSPKDCKNLNVALSVHGFRPGSGAPAHIYIVQSISSHVTYLSPSLPVVFFPPKRSRIVGIREEREANENVVAEVGDIPDTEGSEEAQRSGEEESARTGGNLMLMERSRKLMERVRAHLHMVSSIPTSPDSVVVRSLCDSVRQQAYILVGMAATIDSLINLSLAQDAALRKTKNYVVTASRGTLPGYRRFSVENLNRVWIMEAKPPFKKANFGDLLVRWQRPTRPGPTDHYSLILDFCRRYFQYACDPECEIQGFACRQLAGMGKILNLKACPKILSPSSLHLDFLLDVLGLGDPDIDMHERDLVARRNLFWTTLGSNDEERSNLLRRLKSAKVEFTSIARRAIGRALRELRSYHVKPDGTLVPSNKRKRPVLHNNENIPTE